jgi:hypothetical protein
MILPQNHPEPFLIREDWLSLSPEYRLRDGALHDQATSAYYLMQPPAEYLVGALHRGITFRGLQRIAQRHGMAEHELSEVLGILNSMGALRRRRSLRLAVRSVWQQMYQLILGQYFAALAWRAPALSSTVAFAVAWALLPLAMASLVVSVLVAGSGASTLPTALLSASISLLVLGGSLYGHEMSHLLLIKGRVATPLIFRQGMRLKLIHQPLRRKHELGAALIGPGVGVAICAAVGMLLAWMNSPGLAWTAACIAVFHLASLFPWSPDGAALLKALNKRKRHA